MATDDYLLDEVERSQRNHTRRRRRGRAARRRIYLFIGIALLGLIVLSTPTFVSQSPLGRSMVKRTAASYGLDVEVDSMSVGWITPLSFQGIQVIGTQSGSQVLIDEVDTTLTVRELISANASNFGDVVLRGIDVTCSMQDGRCSLEDDLQQLLAPSDQPSDPVEGSVEIHDASVVVTDVQTGQAWQLAQSNATVALTPIEIRTTFAGVLNEPAGGGGAIQGSLSYSLTNANSGNALAEAAAWDLNLDSESLPLSVVTLLCRRFPSETAGMPTDLSGDATGAIRATGQANGNIQATLSTLQIRNLNATEPRQLGDERAARVWKNKLATFDGDLVLAGNRVIGRDLTAQADFATATLNGAFSRSITLAGESNNPMRWLEALDGSAQAEIDLALLDAALPGLLPLRDETQIIKGRATAQINSQSAVHGRRSRLTIQSDALHARARGRAIVLQPITINTTVLDEQGNVRAESFQLTSSFASAVGEGDFQAGRADFQIDFGRLSAILQPIVDMSDTSLGGSAKGNFQWNASNQNVWRLSGDADASNLLVTLPSGQSLKRQSLRGTLEAVGRWGGNSLEELTRAKASFSSSGLNLDAELSGSVQNPSGTIPLPIKLTANGRMETLAETLGPWLPAELHDVQGGFDIRSQGEFSTVAVLLSDTTAQFTDPRVAYADRWFSQKDVKVDFSGELNWPSGDFYSRSLTVAGDAVSLAMKGQATTKNVDLEVAWRAKLDRIQGSVRKRVANWRREKPVVAKSRSKDNESVFRHVGYQANTAREVAQSDDWLVTGDCEGNFSVKSNGDVLSIDSNSTGKNVSVIQPPDASAQSYTVGPMPRQSNQGRSPGRLHSRVVWSEPNVSVSGPIRLNRQNGKINADGVRIVGDWFATTLTGHAIWNESVGDVVLKGPAGFKMDEISKRLTTLTGTAIAVEGVHETPLEIHAARDNVGNVAFTVQGNLGWDLGEIAGVQFGGATVPVQLTETTVEISPATVPVGQGQVNLAGEVFYRPGPVYLRARPGTVATNLRLTPDMTRRWLKYLAPLAADAAQVDGTMSVELDEAIVIIDTPNLSRVKGRINIEQARMTSGPLTSQIIGGLEQLKSLAQMSVPGEARDPSTLITLPAQTVDFALENGVVSHQRLFFDIDRAKMMSSGQVSLDSRVDLVAQVELDENWLGSDLKGLAGNSVSLPITGTLSRPTLDHGGISDVLTQLGTQAAANVAQKTVNDLLQGQLDKGMQGINKSFKNLEGGFKSIKSFDKLFNR
ncbi:hypothetical protein [Planctomycetes bacterium K23_9]|uniref:Uncharacterized protein n=1 Tax=Stieleria marina TaxID=1930275 RepID=A0A517NPY1_9BACT|nr:hypothetical protein K239x_11300 [Planctomycetes bacterium K23_9]